MLDHAKILPWTEMIKHSIPEVVRQLSKPFIPEKGSILRILISSCYFTEGLDLSVCSLQNCVPSSLEALHSLLDIIQI